MSVGVAFAEESTFDAKKKDGDEKMITTVEPDTVEATEFSIKSKSVGKKPFYGKSSEYTKKQSTSKHSLSFDQNIRSLTGTDVALVCAAITGGLSFVDFGNIAVNYYRSK